MIKIYRYAILLVAIIYPAYLAASFLIPIPTEIRELYSWHGFGGYLDPFGVSPYLFMLAIYVSLFGSFFLKEWGRTMLAAVFVLAVLMGPLWGVLVSRPLESFFNTIISSGIVVVLTLAYTTLDNEFD